MAFLASIGRGIKRSVSGTAGFFRGSVQELKKVKWPTRQELVSSTAVVLIITLLLSIFFFVVDSGIYHLVRLITS
ncbi:preprotein translocase subunit SecE [Staphylospora marina]|uniref:preprotein translocase subunit SecE n=1 Tax=Staphylospora marina TaxID=2490858 RepID=UPI000F5BF7C6|nr:preprotein translocase subunit SecE [Staphylospora marina]